MIFSFFAQAKINTPPPPPPPVIHVEPDTILTLSCDKSGYEVYGYSDSSGIVFYWKLPSGEIKDTNDIFIDYPGDYMLVGIDTATMDSTIQMVYVYEDNVYAQIFLNMVNTPAFCGDTITATVIDGYLKWWQTPYGAVYSDEVVIFEEGEYTAFGKSYTGCNVSQSFTVAEDCHFAKVEGIYFYDYNQNQIREPIEPLLTGGVAQKVDIAGTIVQAPYGDYYKYLGYNQQAVVDWIDNPAWTLTTNNDETPVTGAVNTLTTIDFGLFPAFEHHDLGVYIPYERPKCNTEVTFKNIIFNSGTYEEVGKVEVVYGNLVTYVSSDGMNDANLQTITWDYSGLKPLKDQVVGQMVFLMPDENAIGEEIDLVAKVYSLSNGSYVLKDMYHFQPTVHCAFDPNQKSVSPGGVGHKHLTLLGQDLTYVVEFENEGNAAAIDVFIKDQIDVNLDASTIRILGSSHPVQPWITGNAAKFVFENINLEPAEKGYVEFTIKQKPDLPDFTKIENRAFIYFDNNSAILTNKTFNTLVSAIPYADTLGTKCIPFTIRYHAETTKDIHWKFYHGEPANSVEKDVVVLYTEEGPALTKLFLNDEQYLKVTLKAHDVPHVDYSLSYYNNVAKFTNNTTSTLETSYLWDFGDGTSNTEENPSHTYPSGNSYDIILTAANECGESSQIRNLVITDNGEVSDQFALGLYPNPNKGQFDIQVENNLAEDMEFMIWDVLGQQVFDQKWLNMKDLKTKISVSDLPKGNYHYAFHIGAKRKTGILTIE